MKRKYYTLRQKAARRSAFYDRLDVIATCIVGGLVIGVLLAVVVFSLPGVASMR